MKRQHWLAAHALLVVVTALSAGCGHKGDESAGSSAAPQRQGLARGATAAKQSRSPINPTE